MKKVEMGSLQSASSARISGLSPESSVINIVSGRSSGLFPVYGLPIPPQAGQWLQCKQFDSVFGGTDEIHSYGDSAGITPDFPFNPAEAGTDAANVKECLRRTRGFLIFICAVKVYSDTDKIIRCGGCIIIPAAGSIDIIAQTVFRIEGIVNPRKNTQV